MNSLRSFTAWRNADKKMNLRNFLTLTYANIRFDEEIIAEDRDTIPEQRQRLKEAEEQTEAAQALAEQKNPKTIRDGTA